MEEKETMIMINKMYDIAHEQVDILEIQLAKEGISDMKSLVTATGMQLEVILSRATNKKLEAVRGLLDRMKGTILDCLSVQGFK